jgi:restriction system protein
MNPSSAIQDAVLETLPGAAFQTFGAIIERFWPVLILAFAFSLLGRILRSARVKGHIGEAVVSFGALRRLDPRVYRVFDDLVLPRPDGRGTTQIDHVVVSPFGIFVIETKNYTGWIFGDEDSRQWTQVIYGRKNRFQNPLHQNAMHVRALSKATGLPSSCFYNLVYFVGNATLKTDLPPEVMTEGLASYIRDCREEVIKPEDVAWAVTSIQEAQGRATTHRLTHREQASVDPLGR